jgi:hypothetical protein
VLPVRLPPAAAAPPQQASPSPGGSPSPTVHLSFSDQPTKGVHHDRMLEGIERAKRLQSLPLHMGARADLIASAVLPLAQYGALAAETPAALRHSLRTAALRAVWGPGRVHRCSEALTCFLVKGHRCDPGMSLTYQRVLQLRRWVALSPATRPLVERAWALRPKRHQTRRVLGPVALVDKELRSLGWQWSSPWTLGPGPPGTSPLGLAGGSTGHFLHRLREAVRQRELRHAEQRRSDMVGATRVDRCAVRKAFLTPKRCEPPFHYTKGEMRAVICGAPLMQVHLHRAQLVDNETCPWCKEEPETREHCYFREPGVDRAEEGVA